LKFDETSNRYAALKSGTATKKEVGPASWSITELEIWLETLIAKIAPEMAIKRDSDLFTHGFDSLGATTLHSYIVSALNESENKQPSANITSMWVYAHPTIEKLAQGMALLVAPSNEMSSDLKAQTLAEAIERYTANLPPIAPTSTNGVHGVERHKDVVFLTGSTGGLGSQLLASFLTDERVGKVYAFNRHSSQSVEQRQKVVFEERGLSLDGLDSGKVLYVEGDLAAEHFGLKESLFTEVSEHAT
jgi:hypothetical protein